MNESKLNFLFLPKWLIEEIDKNAKLIWDSNDKNKENGPQKIILNIQNIFRDKYIKEKDIFWMKHCAGDLRELVDRNFETDYHEKLQTLSYSAIIKKLKLYRKFFNNITHFRSEKEIKESRNELLNVKTDQPLTEEEFNKICAGFIWQLYEYINCQVKLHKEIDNWVVKSLENVPIEKLRYLINDNFDLKNYFYSKVDEKWFDLLRKNDFFNEIDKKIKEFSKFDHITPELYYLVETAKKKPKNVTDLILSFPKPKRDIYSVILINHLLLICKDLPVKELKRIIFKIKNEKWIEITNTHNFTYLEMLENLIEAKEFDSFLTLTNIILKVKSKIKKENYFYEKKYFYFEYYLFPKIFEYLVNLNENYYKKSLLLVLNIIIKIIKKTGEKPDSKSIFNLKDNFPFYDVDFFNLNLETEKKYPYFDQGKILFATVISLIRKIMNKKPIFPNHIKNFYKKCFEKAPETQSIWKLKLFFKSLCPTIFLQELKKEFWKLFNAFEENKDYYKIQSGTEYKKALQKSFEFFDSEYQNDFIEKLFKYFGEDCKNKKEESIKGIGWRIASSIYEYLPKEKIEICKEKFGIECVSNFSPTPQISEMKWESISPKAPITEENINLTIKEISEKLKNEWSLESIKKEEKTKGFSESFNIEGVSDFFEKKILSKPDEYLKKAILFFDLNELDAVYTQVFLSVFRKLIESDKVPQKLDLLFKFISNIANATLSNQKTIFSSKNKFFDCWKETHMEIIRILKLFLNPKSEFLFKKFTKFENIFLKIINLLLNSSNPDISNETWKNPFSWSWEGNKRVIANSLHIALNSVRGSCFHDLFINFFHIQIKNKNNPKIKQLKKIYENVLKKEKTRAIKFLFGLQLSFIYFFDKDWVYELLPSLFPKNRKERHLWMSTWEGFMYEKPYEKMFFDKEIRKLYAKAIDYDFKNEQDRKYVWKGPNMETASHFVIAYIYFKNFDFDNELFQKFWNKNLERQSYYLELIGKQFFLYEDLKINSNIRKKLKKLWEWLIDNETDVKTLKSLGDWFELKKKVFEMKWLVKKIRETLEKTKGEINFEHTLEINILKYAKVDPINTLEIIKLFLVDGKINRNKAIPFFIEYDEDQIWSQTFQVLYLNPDTREKTKKLIDDLISNGSKPFWQFKLIIEN